MWAYRARRYRPSPPPPFRPDYMSLVVCSGSAWLWLTEGDPKILRVALLPIPLPSPMMILTVVVWWVGAGSASSVARL